MKLWLVTLHIALVGSNLWATAHFHDSHPDDNEFAEFEDFDDETTASKPIIERAKGYERIEKDIEQDNGFEEEEEEEEDVLVEDADNEFDHFHDEEEFEGLDMTGNNAGAKADEPSTLTITKVPLHLRDRWDSFYLEILMLCGILIYFVNYMIGRSKNCKIAETWYADQKSILCDNFSLVGDTGKSQDESIGNGLVKESESQYSLYCTGRVGCDSLLVELKMIKRQDLVAVLAQIMRPQNDQAHLRFELTKDETDNFVLAVATKRTATHLAKDMADISVYCPEKRPGEKFGFPTGFYVMSEIAEAASAVFDNRFIQTFTKYSQYIDYIHISDQYSGPKAQEESSQLAMPDVKRVLLVGLNISLKGRFPSDSHEKTRPLLQLTLYLLDKLRRFKLSKEGKAKTDKNRMRVEEAFLKSTHAARAEAAAQRREERRRAEKERILQEEDPDKQRKWEEKEQRRLAKRRTPKIKPLKVKAM